ncbi:Fe2+-dependent dioxygenase [Zavarzinia compransoris]|uniref:Fe2+-dependent dioxygenase n=1 Tax=Zavarzinia marina TaxID=2911065 RepID=UPI001F2849B9|nr:Fe2+-dependent dioxygenase [Zavarzinia marina]MCF4166764.1 Fe2+-dependent dioxygenase [Zavarzinia marina]
MLIVIPDLLPAETVVQMRAALERAAWVDGKVTAGQQSAKAKHNLQIPEGSEVAQALGDQVLKALGRNPEFLSAAQPLRIYPPLFNRYDTGMRFDAHVDNAIRMVTGHGMRIRTDVSATLFLSDPDSYDGGELVIEDTYGSQAVKLPAGHMVVYPATSLHRVTPVTRGSRWASFFWIQSLVRDDGQRRLLYEMDVAIRRLRAELDDEHPSIRSLVSTYHNLLRRWAEM